jgi:pantoate--beta-alanine ligase
MRVVTTRAELSDARDATTGRPLALVPTMGALHEGHRTLIRRAHEGRGPVYVSIFVNPLQFGPNEDLDRYPRRLDVDLAMCEAEGVDVVFAPSVEEMYAGGAPGVRVTAGALGDVLEGKTRPGHFDGVLTVVAKLFNLVRPDVAYFGQKDAQQLALVRRMVRDLDVPLEIVGVPTVREADGLALSSRNAYLDEEARWSALALSKALDAGRRAAGHGAAAVLEDARAVVNGDDGVRVDYLELRDAGTFEPAHPGTERAVLLVAAWVGGTRLIDNVTLDLGASADQ